MSFLANVFYLSLHGGSYHRSETRDPNPWITSKTKYCERRFLAKAGGNALHKRLNSKETALLAAKVASPVAIKSMNINVQSGLIAVLPSSCQGSSRLFVFISLFSKFSTWYAVISKLLWQLEVVFLWFASNQNCFKFLIQKGNPHFWLRG